MSRSRIPLFSLSMAAGALAVWCGCPEDQNSDTDTENFDTEAIVTASSTLNCCSGPGQYATVAVENRSNAKATVSISFPPAEPLGMSAEPNEFTLAPGERRDVAISISICPDEVVQAQVNIVSKVIGFSSEDLDLEYLDVRPCTLREKALIAISVLTGLEGFGAVSSSDEIFGGSAERLVIAADQTYGVVDVAAGTTEVVSSGDAAHFGVVPLAGGSDAQLDVLVAFGAGGLEIRPFDPDIQEFSIFAQFDPANSAAVFDVVPYAGDPGARGVVVARSNEVESREYSSDLTLDGLNEGPIAISPSVIASLGSQAGAVVSAFAFTPTGPVVVATEGDPNSGPGALYFWTAADSDTLTLIGDAGNTPRRIRGVEIDGTWILAVSNFGDSTITLLTGDGTSVPAITETAMLGGKPIGIDIATTADGRGAVIASGFDTNTYTVVTVDLDGTVSQNTTANFDPAEIQGPGHAIWLNDGAAAFSGNTSNTVLILPDLLP